MGLLDSIKSGYNTFNQDLGQGMTSPLFTLGMGLVGAAQPFANPAQQIQGAQANALNQQAARQQMLLQQLQMRKTMAMLQGLGGLYGQGAPAASPPNVAPPQAQAPQGGLLTTGGPRVAPAASPAPAAPPWLTPITDQTIAQTPLTGGINPRAAEYVTALQTGDPVKAAQMVHDAQLKLLQQRNAPVLSLLDTVRQSDNPVQYMQNSQQLSAAWPILAQQLGLDPSKPTAQSVRTAMTFARNQLSGELAEPTVAPPVPLVTSTDQYGRTIQTDPISGKQTVQAAPQLEKVVTAAHPEGVLLPPSQAIGKQPYNQWTANSAQMTGEVGALDAALTSLGVTIPGGRGGQLYAIKLKNLVAANPGVPPEQIAQMVKTGQLDYNGQKRSTGQLSQVLASTTAFSLQLEKNLNSLATVEKAVDKTGVPVLNRAFAAYQRNVSGSKDIAKYTAYFNAVTSEYAKLISGGTGVAAPNESDMKEARNVITQAYTQGGLEGLRDALTTEANNKRESYQAGLEAARRTSTASATPAPIASPAAPASKVLTYDPATGTFK